MRPAHLLLSLLPFGLPALLATQDPPLPTHPSPPEVTNSAVARRHARFHGSANCVACH